MKLSRHNLHRASRRAGDIIINEDGGRVRREEEGGTDYGDPRVGMTEQGDPRERFILCVIDASFGRNAEEAREGGGEAGRKEGNRN